MAATKDFYLIIDESAYYFINRWINCLVCVSEKQKKKKNEFINI